MNKQFLIEKTNATTHFHSKIERVGVLFRVANRRALGQLERWRMTGLGHYALRRGHGWLRLSQVGFDVEIGRRDVTVTRDDTRQSSIVSLSC